MHMASENLSAPYQLDNGRLVLAMHYMGDLFNLIRDVEFKEFDFGISVARKTTPRKLIPRTVIANGYIVRPETLEGLS